MTATNSSSTAGSVNGKAATPSALALSNTWWALGHATFLVFALFFLIFPSVTYFYKVAMLGLVASYATDVYRVYASSSVSTQYVLLLPLSVYSLFNVLQQARSDSRIYELPAWKQYMLQPTEQLLSFQTHALNLATQLEILAAPWLLLSIFSLGIILPLTYISYLRWQYFVSPRMRLVFASWDQLLTKITEHHSCPKMVRRVYSGVKAALKKWIKVQPPVPNRPTTTAPPRKQH